MIDIQPTMDDNQVMDFVSRGSVVLEGVVSDEFNRRCETLPGGSINEFACSPGFRNEVLLHPEVAGVARSLLGQNFFMPITAHHHLLKRHTPARHGTPMSLRIWLRRQSFAMLLHPQDVTLEDGPTMVPSRFASSIGRSREAIAHYGDILGQLSLTVPAGTVVLTHYGIWHKAGPKLNAKRRGMIKFSYFRSSPPKRDWLIASEEIPPYANRERHLYANEVESYRDMARRQRTWNWLCGVDTPPEVSHGAKLFIDARPLSEIANE